MIVLRILGGVVLLAAVAVLGYDLIRMAQGMGGLTALGELWSTIDPESLSLLQAGIERHAGPGLWTQAFVQLLLWPAVAVIGGLGLVLLALGSIGGGRRRRQALR